MERREAIDKSLTRYFTGRPCNRGHVCDRYVSTGNCVLCLHPPIGKNHNFVGGDARHKAAQNLKKTYYTGIPCKRGHFCDRYTSTGGCLWCLRPLLANPDLPYVKLRRDNERKTILMMTEPLVRIRLRIFDDELQAMTNFILMTAKARFQLISLKHVTTRRLPLRITKKQCVHEFKCYPEDVSMLRAAQDASEAARTPPPAPPVITLGPDTPAPSWTERP